MKKLLLAGLTVELIVNSCASAPKQQEKQPNILIILADDLGYQI